MAEEEFIHVPHEIWAKISGDTKKFFLSSRDKTIEFLKRICGCRGETP